MWLLAKSIVVSVEALSTQAISDGDFVLTT
uniref:Uncharacterized protein n=1 Tax=Anguilla anguilla TaxID=7936 RepID=A0A0E9UIU8_ANGAN